MRRFTPLSAYALQSRCTPAAAAAYRLNSTEAPKADATPPCRPTCAITTPNFADDTSYRERSLWYLFKALFVLKLCSVPQIAQNAVPLMKSVEKILGSTLTYNLLVKKTFYNYFCAGENDQEIRETIRSLQCRNIGAVLDYAAEADTPEGFTPAPGLADAPDISMASLVHKPNVKYPMDEHLFDDTMKLYMMSIMHASLYSPRDYPGVMATKVTGMCDPQLLARVSAILLSIHQSWCIYFTEGDVPKIEECRVVMGLQRKHQLFISYEQLKEGFAKYNPEAARFTDAQMAEIIELLDPRKLGKINYFNYKQALTDAVTAVEPTAIQQVLVQRLPPLSDTEKKLWAKVNQRLHHISAAAKTLNVRVLVDAEQTFYQPAIDAIVGTLQREFNKDLPVVYNTYQCYLTYAEDRVVNDFVRSRHQGFHWGGKIVRGAYIVQERATAAQYSYTSPIWGDQKGTNDCYNNTARRIFDMMEKESHMKHEVLFGTHNQESLEIATKEVLARPSLQPRVSFGQLFGMRDNLTVPLSRAGFHVLKYVPYGPVRETIHYLGRRAVENASILTSGDNAETLMMKKEIKRRLGMGS